MDFPALRKMLRPVVGDLKDHCTNTSMPEFCRQLGLPVPDDAGSKRDRMHTAFDALEDEEISGLVQALLAQRLLAPAVRNQVQDLLWAAEPVIVVPKRHRRELARALQTHNLFRHWGHFAQLLRDIFVIPDDLEALILGTETGALAEIHRHFVRNPEDADVEWLFERLPVFDLSEQRFRRWLEGLTSADVQTDVDAQLAIVEAMNAVLRTCGAELRQISEAGGYPVFGLVALRAARGRPKNIIFASRAKPDIRLSDSLENDIEILSNPDEVLVYDRPLGPDGLRWRELQHWWAEMTGEPDATCAKNSLYRRLLQSLPSTSPPQRLLFDAFFRGFGQAVHELPALLPEVWLHWDPKTVAERGAKALLNHRMDFLMLMPAGGRVVIEVDGIQHYSDNSQRANTRKYAQLVAGDRELKLAGYDVYRFAGVELQGDEAPARIKAFFVALLLRHGVRAA